MAARRPIQRSSTWTAAACGQLTVRMTLPRTCPVSTVRVVGVGERERRGDRQGQLFCAGQPDEGGEGCRGTGASNSARVPTTSGPGAADVRAHETDPPV